MAERIAKLISGDPPRQKDIAIAEAILNDSGVQGYFEQKAANETARRGRQTGYCPTCGADMSGYE
jgi:hypothetical protein